MQFLADYFPLLLFFLAFKLQGIFVATAVAIVASIAQIAYFRWHRGRVAAVHWMSLAIIVVFGGATLLLHDETFIKWKPTVLYWLFAVVLATGRLAFRKNLLSTLLKDLTLPDSIWARLTWGWVVFLGAMGVANLYIAAHFTTDVWVNFKVWGGIGLFMLAAVGTVASVARYLPGES
ncbi:MAG TPA: septation protein A [Casimicrobiaceae bacterium]|nr:septation protein A [Casimicrobiaceae bacterium]